MKQKILTPPKNTIMEILIHRGSHEVGGNCLEIRAGQTRLILDVGMPLFDENREPLDTFAFRRLSTSELREQGILPAVPGLFQEDDRPAPDAVLLSHAHLDHTGLLPHVRPEIPVYATSGTSKMMLAEALFAGQQSLPREQFQEIKPEVPFQIGEIQVTGFSVDHSIFGGLALLIEAEEKRLLYSGDLRLHGRKPGMHRNLIEAMSNKPLDVLLMEGTHFSFPDKNWETEYQLEDVITQQIQQAPGLVLASFSPQHIDRLVAFIRAAKKTGRTFVADVYTAFVLHLLKNEVPTLPQADRSELVQVYLPESSRKSAARKNLTGILEKFQKSEITLKQILENPKRHLMVFRPSMLAEFGPGLPTETTCLYSRWSGYLQNDDWKTVITSLQNTSGNLVEVHTSGHILSSDIVRLVEQLQPKTVIPIHTFEPERFQEHFDNVTVLEDGEVLTVL